MIISGGGGKTSRKLSEEELQLMVESGYSNKAIDLYVNNVNVGTLTEPSIVTTFLGPCGDLIKLYLHINEKDIIKDAKFYYLGCPGSASSASAMTILIKGRTINQAKKLTEQDVLDGLGGLPKSKLDCARLSIKTLRKAIARYEKLKGRSEV
jgi:NifU-like protein involved in Fe-S cluster formation